MKIGGNAVCVFILAVDILMSSVLVEFSGKLFIISQPVIEVSSIVDLSSQCMIVTQYNHLYVDMY